MVDSITPSGGSNCDELDFGILTLPPGLPTTSTSSSSSSQQGEEALYELKSRILEQKCVEISNDTTRIYWNLIQKKRLLSQVISERWQLRGELEQRHDSFETADIPAFRDESAAYELLVSQKHALADTESPKKSPKKPSNGTSATKISPTNGLRLSHDNDKDGSASQRFDPLAALFEEEEATNASALSESCSTPATKGKSKGKHSKSDAGGPAKKKRKRLPKDPNAPKKPVNAYFIFCEEKRTGVQLEMSQGADDGKADRKEVTRRLGQLWVKLTTEEKQVYFDKYNLDKTRFEKEQQEYMRSQGLGSVTGNGLSEVFSPANGSLEDSAFATLPRSRKSSSASSSNGANSSSSVNAPGASPLNGNLGRDIIDDWKQQSQLLPPASSLMMEIAPVIAADSNSVRCYSSSESAPDNMEACVAQMFLKQEAIMSGVPETFFQPQPVAVSPVASGL